MDAPGWLCPLFALGLLIALFAWGRRSRSTPAPVDRWNAYRGVPVSARERALSEARTLVRERQQFAASVLLEERLLLPSRDARAWVDVYECAAVAMLSFADRLTPEITSEVRELTDAARHDEAIEALMSQLEVPQPAAMRLVQMVGVERGARRVLARRPLPHGPMSEDELAQVEALLVRRRRDEAADRYRQITGATEEESKSYLDELSKFLG